MSEYIRLGGYDKTSEKGVIEYMPASDGNGIVDIEFFLPSEAFKLGLNKENSPFHESNSEIFYIWEDIVNYKDRSTSGEIYLTELNKAILAWDTQKVAKLHTWFNTVASFKKAPLSSLWSAYGESYKEIPLKDGVSNILHIIEKLALKNGEIPSKSEVRNAYSGVGKDVDKVIKNIGFNWLDNKTRKGGGS